MYEIILKNNGLSVVFLLLFILSIIGQAYFGLQEYNKEMTEESGQALTIIPYLPAYRAFP